MHMYTDPSSTESGNPRCDIGLCDTGVTETSVMNRLVCSWDYRRCQTDYTTPWQGITLVALFVWFFSWKFEVYHLPWQAQHRCIRKTEKSSWHLIFIQIISLQSSTSLLVLLILLNLIKAAYQIIIMQRDIHEWGTFEGRGWWDIRWMLICLLPGCMIQPVCLSVWFMLHNLLITDVCCWQIIFIRKHLNFKRQINNIRHKWEWKTIESLYCNRNGLQ